MRNKRDKNRKRKVSSTDDPKPRPSCITVDSEDSDSSMSVDSETPPENLCCIRKRNTPKEFHNCDSRFFVKWAQCDGFRMGCPAITGHILFLLRVLRRNDNFYCPHCVHPSEE